MLEMLHLLRLLTSPSPWLLAGVAAVAAVVFIPGALPFVLKNWKLAAMGALVLVAGFFFTQARQSAADLASVSKQRDEAVAQADAWKTAYDDAKELADRTAAARAVETTQLINLARAAGTAKEGIAHAPGADDRFHYSDAAYGFLRARPTETAGAAAKANSGVDGR